MRYTRINELIARHIFHWTYIGLNRWSTPNGEVGALINWAEDLDQAMNIVIALRKDYCIEMKDEGECWEVWIGIGHYPKPVQAVTLELAICLSALRVKGVENVALDYH